MPLEPNMQEPQESFFKPLQFLAKASMPASVNSRQARSLSRVRFRQRKEIWTRASSPMLTDRRSHFNASLVTASNREKIEGIRDCRSDSALSDRRCRLCPSTRNHRRQTREQLLRSPEPRDWKMQAKHSSGRSEM
uniref:Uncharacterized protein n=1 Tax=Nelumbo nucifera TaxID=4432 RepID=A0A822ZD65_NELNU|nr:TPA_asm: hypothetical protein HUJ06_015678 [Nelumbo nucifera]